MDEEGIPNIIWGLRFAEFFGYLKSQGIEVLNEEAVTDSDLDMMWNEWYYDHYSA